MLASGGGGALYVDTLKSKRARTVPLVEDLVPVADRWSAGKAPDAWLFAAPEGGPLRESNWKRSVSWSAATAAARIPGFPFAICVTPLRRSGCWRRSQGGLASPGARLGGDSDGPIRHLVDGNLWQAARIVGHLGGI